MNIKQTVVYIRTRFAGFHRWKNAPDQVAFLRDFHRHEFHVKVAVPVNHDNRDVEFLQLKARVDAVLTERYKDKKFEESCEMIASNLVDWFDAVWADVSEDGENGAVVNRFTPIQIETQPKEANLSPDGTKKLKEEFEEYQKGLKRYLRSTQESFWKGAFQGTALEVDLNQISIHDRIRTKPFVGIEAEGPYKGDKTLFIPGSFPSDQVERLFEVLSHAGCKRVYFGAGNDYANLNLNTLAAILKLIPPESLIVECHQLTTQLTRMLDHRTVIVVHVPPAEFSWRNVFYKHVTNGQVVWETTWMEGAQDKITTQLDDPLYQQDQEISF